MSIPSDEPVYRRSRSDKNSRSQRIRTLFSPSLKMPNALVVEDFPSCFGEKLSLGKALRLPRKTKGTEHKDVLPVFASRSAGKLQLDKDSSSGKLQLDKDSSPGKKPNTTKPKGIAKRFYFRPVEESLPKAKRLHWFEEEEDESLVIGIADLSDQIEAMNNKVDMDEIFFGGHEGLISQSNIFANAAISYLQDKGHKLELVNAGSYEGKIVGYGMRFHHNFKAKRADDPHAPVEMYFAQFYDGATLRVECCVSLGESDSLPYERDNQGCIYCTEFVHHPRGDCEGRIIGGQVVWGPRVI